jgi:O-antigen/teichoic acid export membrane protein
MSGSAANPEMEARSYFSQLFGKVFRLGSGELLARLCTVSVAILIGHLYGVVFLGVYGLATSLSQYLYPVIDFGLKHVGARLLARFPRSADEIIHRVQRRRLLMALFTLPLLFAYASLAHLAIEYKIFLFTFSAIGALYAFSLEWAAWGGEQMLLVGLSKAIVPACILLAVLVGLAFNHVLSRLVVGNLIGYCLQAIVFWAWWRRCRSRIDQPEHGVVEIAEALEWRRTSIMGLAWMANLAFNTVDMLMLGVLSNPEQVGLYSAAYRILNQVLITYYLLTSVLYPQLARQDRAQRRGMLRPAIILALLGSGTLLAGLLMLFRRPLLTLFFGAPFTAAASLLFLVAAAIPLDFLTSYLSNAYIAWSMERHVLVCVVIAAGSNIILNLATIPRYGAMAAAINTIISYLVYLGALAWKARAVTRNVDGLSTQEG